MDLGFLADSFAKIEAQNLMVAEVLLSLADFREISRNEDVFTPRGAGKGKMWGADVSVSRELKPGEVFLAYMREDAKLKAGRRFQRRFRMPVRQRA